MEMLGPLCNQTVNLETDAKTLYYSLLKKKTHTHKPDILPPKIFKSMDHSLCPKGHMP